MADAAPPTRLPEFQTDHPDIPGRRHAQGRGGHDRLERGQGHLAVAGQAHRGHEPRRQSRRSRRSDHQGCGDQVHRPHRSGSPGADPARCRARHGRGRAGAVAEDAGDDRPRHRQRLLLRLRQAGAVPPRRSRQDRKEDGARSSPGTRRSRRSSGAASRRRISSASAARTSRSSWSTPSPKTKS